MDDIDVRILQELQRDGRLPNQELADRVGLSPSACLRRVRRLEQEGVVSSYRAVIDQRRIGLPVTAFVRLRLDRHTPEAIEAVERAIRRIDNVVEAHMLAGDADFLLRVLASDLAGYEALARKHIRTIPHIASIDTTFAYGTTKPPSPYPISPP